MKNSNRETIKTCLDCEYYSMVSSRDMGRTSLDHCDKNKEYLPTAAFCFNDTCCPTASNFNVRAFTIFQDIAGDCIHYKKKEVIRC
ncbi:MAG: hypothetical protein V2J25_02320 [Desulfatiglans sp.]|nr:hypothetical protein [Thermodesulfobacteriota bacterium]MEE4351679.1 hypothetical protein [Desulfatiglans sp.]